MIRKARSFVVFLALIGPCAATAQFTPIMRLAPLPAEIKKEITNSGLPESSWAVAIVPLPPQAVMGPVLTGYGLNAETPMNPASVMKLVTTRAALGLLGPQFRHQTRIATTGRLESGTLKGELFFQGGGDPKLVVEDLDEIARRMKAMGIERIEGTLVVDGTRFDEPEVDPGLFDRKPLSSYNVGPHAAMVNFKSIKISVWSDSGRRVRIQTEPRLPEKEVIQRVELVKGGCGNTRVSARMESAGKGAEPKLTVSGVLGRQCNGVDFYVSVMDHARFAMAALRAAWEGAGGVMKVKLQSGATPSHARTLVQWESPRPLIELVADINKMSNNPMTRQLFLNLSANDGRPATREESRLAVKAYLASRGLVFPELVMDNGSGLSRTERISAKSLASLLADGLAGADAQAWVDTLPAAGIEGTMRNRMRDTVLEGRAWLKTGSLDDVRALAGYIRSAEGRWVVFAAMVNDPQAAKAKSAMDSLVKWAYTYH